MRWPKQKGGARTRLPRHAQEGLAPGGRLGAAEFIAALAARLLPALRRPSILSLVNGPCHRSRLAKKARRAAWRQRGLRRLSLPPHRPHLNRIETLWSLREHHWLPAGAHENFATLRATATALLNAVGLKLPCCLLADAYTSFQNE